MSLLHWGIAFSLYFMDYYTVQPPAKLACIVSGVNLKNQHVAWRVYLIILCPMVSFGKFGQTESSLTLKFGHDKFSPFREI